MNAIVKSAPAAVAPAAVAAHKATATSAFDAACVSTATPTQSALLEKMLTKSQIAIATDLSSLDFDSLRAVATNGKGASKKLALEFVALADLDNVFSQFAKSGFKNVRPLAVLIRSITGKFTHSDSFTGLTACPMTRAGFLEYPANVALWACASTNEKTNAARAKLAVTVSAIVERANGLITASYAASQAEQAAMQAEQAAVQAEQAAMQAEQAATVKAYCLDSMVA